MVEQVKSFLHGSNKVGSTEVCTETAAPVTQEHITKHEHIETAEAIDREKHVHHHQHRVQPVVANEVLATEHETNIVPEVTREIRHEMPAEHEHKMHQMHNQYHDERVIGETERTATNLGTQVNEHTHHHVHEHIQPVIQKEVHANKTVHTVIPIHEKIHEAPVIHESTTLPTVSLEEFQKQHGVTGEHHGESSHQHAFYKGEPRAGEERREERREEVVPVVPVADRHHSEHHHHHERRQEVPVVPVVPVERTDSVASSHHNVDNRSTGATTGIGPFGNHDTTTEAGVPGSRTGDNDRINRSSTTDSKKNESLMQKIKEKF